ncbi:hypothetical protein GN244_ATG13188 [Phytophthora infestans]|uniref:Uncharacterized protein n=1 Tax=Phytophthora infestans TaxID=4787 RepID=A0A833T729_PHYIN|nr:hypothetical protein GN244_ATG13188 [Phytophthora infestans]
MKWESALHRFRHTTNAKDHLYALQRSHPIGQAEASKRLKNATTRLDDVNVDTRVRDSKRSAPEGCEGRPMK